MYCNGNPKTKKELKTWVSRGHDNTGMAPRAFQPGGLFGSQTDGRATIEGPHYPQPHRWYAAVMLKGGKIVKVVS